MSGLLKAFFLFFYPDLNTNSMTVARSYQDGSGERCTLCFTVAVPRCIPQSKHWL